MTDSGPMSNENLIIAWFCSSNCDMIFLNAALSAFNYEEETEEYEILTHCMSWQKKSPDVCVVGAGVWDCV